MAGFDGFAEITERNAALAPYTGLRLGGPAEYLVRLRSRDELQQVFRHCIANQVPVRVLGGGCNVLVRDKGVSGVVLQLSAPAFKQLGVIENGVTAGAGATLADLISFAAKHGLGGLEVLVGIAGTVGGAVRGNAGDRHGEIGQFVRSVEVMDEAGDIQRRDRDELQFDPQGSNLDDPVILGIDFELDSDDPDAIVKHMRKAWIQRKATQPLTSQPHARMFRNTRSVDAATLIEQADLSKTQVGGAEISSRHANSVVVHPGGTVEDVLKLVETVREGVEDRSGVELELELAIW